MVSKSIFSKYNFGRVGGGRKKEYSVYTLDNVDNSEQNVVSRPCLRFDNKVTPLGSERQEVMQNVRLHHCVPSAL